MIFVGAGGSYREFPFRNRGNVRYRLLILFPDGPENVRCSAFTAELSRASTYRNRGDLCRRATIAFLLVAPSQGAGAAASTPHLAADTPEAKPSRRVSQCGLRRTY